ncbi:MAG: NAD-dependent epimerase/dehydratase [Glaciihabitans sp.]|nr:NAD-dependent epimerase/dehydratase [Glaciihabitans sp.]
MRILVTGGAGFLGSHLTDALLDRGDDVVVLDDMSTGSPDNLTPPRRGLTIVDADVRAPLLLDGPFDAIAHLASPASPPDYLRRPVFTLTTGSLGTQQVLEFAARKKARVVLASTSEVYGDPEVHPQTENYWGNVNSVGPRAVYDEAKRYAEALTTAFGDSRGVDTGIVRIFNTYGPRLRPEDGRVVSNFIAQALAGRPLTVYGDGTQTRSLCYVDDLVRGLISMIDARGERGPINLGNPVEMSVRAIADLVLRLTGSTSRLEWRPLPIDDPVRRRPDITRAAQRLGWQPATPVATGIERTIAWQRESRPENLIRPSAVPMAS